MKNAQFLAPLYGSEHADVGKNLEYRGMIYKAMGEHEKANGFFMQAIDIYQKLNCHNRAQQVKALMN